MSCQARTSCVQWFSPMRKYFDTSSMESVYFSHTGIPWTLLIKHPLSENEYFKSCEEWQDYMKCKLAELADKTNERNTTDMTPETDFDDEGYEQYREETGLPKIKR